MSTVVVFVVLGVGTGALYGALATSVIIAYRGSGVVNFAVGAMAMFYAIVFAELRTTGDLILPVMVVPDRYDLGDPLATVPAALVALAVGTATSLAIFYLVVRPMRTSPAVSMLVATVGITIVLQGLAVRSFGNRAVRTPTLLPRGTIELFDRTIPVDRFWVLGAVVLIGIVAQLLLVHTRAGLATRAAFLNEKGVILLGFDPARLGLYNWLIAATIGGVVGILATSLGGVTPFSFSLFVVPALGAALAARLASIPVAIAAGVAIGGFESVAVHLVARRLVPDALLGGISSLVPFVVIVTAIALVGRTLPDRSTIFEHAATPADRSRFRVELWGTTIAVAVLLLTFGDATIRFALMQSTFVFVLVLSIVVLTGFVGQVSLAQLSFAGFSAFMLSRFDEALPFPLSPLAAIAVTTVVGTLVGIPALRVRGIQFAIVTLATAVVFDEVLFRSPSFVGTAGVARVESPELFGIELGIDAGGGFPTHRFGFALLVVAVLMGLLVQGARSGMIGRRFIAVRANERAAAASALGVARTKVFAAALASFIAGVAGVMIGYKARTLTGAGLDADESLELVALAYLGGIGSIAGAVVAAALAPSGIVGEIVFGGGSSINQFILTGVGLVVVTRRFPRGLVGSIGAARTWLARRRAEALDPDERPPPTPAVLRPDLGEARWADPDAAALPTIEPDDVPIEFDDPWRPS